MFPLVRLSTRSAEPLHLTPGRTTLQACSRHQHSSIWVIHRPTANIVARWQDESGSARANARRRRIARGVDKTHGDSLPSGLELTSVRHEGIEECRIVERQRTPRIRDQE